MLRARVLLGCVLALALTGACLSIDGFAGGSADAGVADTGEGEGSVPDSVDMAEAGDSVDGGSGDSGTGEAGDAGDVCEAGTIARADVCVPAPVAYWKLDEGAGSEVVDAITGLRGALRGSPTWTAGAVGPGALAFDGIDDHVELGARPDLVFGKRSFSYTLLVFVTSNAGEWDMPWYFGGSSATNPGYDIELGNGPWIAIVSDGASMIPVSFGSAVTNQWLRLSVVVDRNAKLVRAYKNNLVTGQVSISDAFGAVSPVTVAVIGSDDDGQAGVWFKGAVDDVMIFDRALTSAEIGALAP